MVIAVACIGGFLWLREHATLLLFALLLTFSIVERARRFRTLLRAERNAQRLKLQQADWTEV